MSITPILNLYKSSEILDKRNIQLLILLNNFRTKGTKYKYYVPYNFIMFLVM